MIVLTIITLLLAGLLDGLHEAYVLGNRKFFENLWGVKPISYFGSLSWLLAYKDNDAKKGFKSRYREWMGAFDFYHHSDRLRIALYMLSAVLVAVLHFTNVLEYNLYLMLFTAYIFKSLPNALAFSYVRKVDKNNNK